MGRDVTAHAARAGLLPSDKCFSSTVAPSAYICLFVSVVAELCGCDSTWTMKHMHALCGPSWKTFAGPEIDREEIPRCSFSLFNACTELKNTWECHL